MKTITELEIGDYVISPYPWPRDQRKKTVGCIVDIKNDKAKVKFIIPIFYQDGKQDSYNITSLDNLEHITREEAFIRAMGK